MINSERSQIPAVITYAPLAGNASFTQAAIDRLGQVIPQGAVKGFVQASHAGTLYLEESDDNSSFAATVTVSVAAATAATLPWTKLTKRYFRFKYTNGATTQTSFKLLQFLTGAGVSDALLVESTGQPDDAVVAAGAVGSLSAKIRRLTTDMDALLTKVGEVQASPTANTILARLKDIKDGIQLTGSTALIGKTGLKMVPVTANFVRPADTTAYAAGDAVSTLAGAVFELDFTSVGAAVGQAIMLHKLVFVTSTKQTPTQPLVNIFLSNVTFTGTLADNSALDIADAAMISSGCWYVCDEQNYTAGNSIVSKTKNEPIILAAADKKLYGICQAAAAWTPGNADTYYILAFASLM